MSSCAIRVEGLGKRYNIGASQGYRTLRESIKDTFLGPFRRMGSVLRGEGTIEKHAELWALRDLSFDIAHGDVVAVIGRNGAGKSTLLKILSRITEPTTGFIGLNGRVGSLLEVGTGFHPELTGRENVYLNGAILGMPRSEINRKFDEIVAFAEVDRFLDTPVKHYSSGMYMRLAFAVAAHLEPEILVVDEVLAVGDAMFQKKCLGKMGDVAQQGRTVLFVSHNMAAVTTVCRQAILLEEGKRVAMGPVADVVGKYLASGSYQAAERTFEADHPANSSNLRLHAVRVLSEGELAPDVRIDRDLVIEIEFENLKAGAMLGATLHLIDKHNIEVLATAALPSIALGNDPLHGNPYPTGHFASRCRIPANFLNEGMYTVNALFLVDHQRVETKVDGAVSFTVHETGEMRHEYKGHWLGVVRPRLEWKTERLQS